MAARGINMTEVVKAVKALIACCMLLVGTVLLGAVDLPGFADGVTRAEIYFFAMDLLLVAAGLKIVLDLNEKKVPTP